jgi:hypothetical protein
LDRFAGEIESELPIIGLFVWFQQLTDLPAVHDIGFDGGLHG